LATDYHGYNKKITYLFASFVSEITEKYGGTFFLKNYLRVLACPAKQSAFDGLKYYSVLGTI